MSIASEISRLQTAKADLKTAIEAKGVTVSSSATLDEYPALVHNIQQGSQLNVQPRKQITIASNTTLVPLSIFPDSGYDVMESVEATVNVPQGAVGVQSGTFKEDADFFGSKTFIVRGWVDVFVLQCQDDMTAQNTYLQSMYAIRDTSNTGQAAQYYGIRGSSSALALLSSSLCTVQFDNGSVTLTFGQSVAKLKANKYYRWFAYAKEVTT